MTTIDRISNALVVYYGRYEYENAMTARNVTERDNNASRKFLNSSVTTGDQLTMSFLAFM